MHNYETVFILDPTLGDDRTAQEIERAKSVIESSKGEVTDIQRWGKRKLAYEIKKRREGVYTVLKYRSDGSAVFELERSLRLNEQVLRFMTVQDEGPAGEVRAGRGPAGESDEAEEESRELQSKSGSVVSEPEGHAPESRDSGDEGESGEEVPEEERPSGEAAKHEGWGAAGGGAQPGGRD